MLFFSPKLRSLTFSNRFFVEICSTEDQLRPAPDCTAGLPEGQLYHRGTAFISKGWIFSFTIIIYAFILLLVKKPLSLSILGAYQQNKVTKEFQ